MKLRRVFDKIKTKSTKTAVRQQTKENKQNIQNKVKLQTNKQIPIGREFEHSYIQNQIEKFIKFGNSNILYISGVPGCGKTYTVNYILNNLGKQIIKTFVNCTVLTQKTQIYKEILKTFPCNVNKNTSGLQELRSHFLVEKCKHLIVLDEIDFLMNRNEKVLYNLFDLVHLPESNVFMILLSNTLGKLSSKVESRIGNNRLEFKPYSAQQIENIMRAEDDTSISVVNKFIAKKVASATGDYRKAVDLIKTKPKNIKEANLNIKDYYKSIIREFYDKLNIYQKIVINVLNGEKSNKIDIIGLFETFKTHCKINGYKYLDYFSYVDVIEDLSDFGFIRISGREIKKLYIEEELS